MGTPEEGEEGLLMDIITGRDGDVDNWKEVILIYSSALKQIGTKLEILNDEFQHVHSYNPIEHIKSRIKTAESIVKKLRRYGYESTISNMVEYINDIAGIRVICSFVDDIYTVAEMLARQDDINVLMVKDYIRCPKVNGYRSYHMIIEIPVFFSDRKEKMRVEVQIRTMAMDFWATLEHGIRYKSSDEVPAFIVDELRNCADVITRTDAKMQEIFKALQLLNDKEDDFHWRSSED